MKLLIPLKYIYHHPLTRNRRILAFGRFFFWQTISRIKKEGIVFQWIHGAKLFIKRGMHGATGSYYAYLHDFQEMSFLLHFINDKDVLWDIGANIGSYTILASKVAHAKVYAFEPVPSTYRHLINNIELNQVSSRVHAMNIGLSDAKGSLYFTGDLDTVNHVATENDRGNTINVNVATCDGILSDTNMPPSIIKLDVEGFEYPVLKGAESLLKNQRLQAIIIELNGMGKRFGFNDLEIHYLLLGHGFHPYDYLPFDRKLNKLQWPFHTANVIYCRDLETVSRRLEKGMIIQTPDFQF